MASGSGRVGTSLSAKQLATVALTAASPAATFHGSVDLMLTKLKLNDRIVLRARHYGALPDHGPRYDVRMVWHQTATHDLAHAWLRSVVRRLFQRDETTALDS